MKCNKCGKAGAYFRIRQGDFFCRNCGQSFKQGGENEKNGQNVKGSREVSE